jgi:hypothetical protein
VFSANFLLRIRRELSGVNATGEFYRGTAGSAKLAAHADAASA